MKENFVLQRDFALLVVLIQGRKKGFCLFQRKEFDAFRLLHLWQSDTLTGVVKQYVPLNRRTHYAADRGVCPPDRGSRVAALVAVPISLSYRYYGADEFILNDQTFMQDSGTDSVMYYAFDTTDEANGAMEKFLADYTENVNPQFDYESKALYASEFEGMRSMFQLCGGALSFIVGLVGVLNFFNAILTGIIARKREFAVLQSIGMTGKQLKTMLVYEGLLYALGAAGISLVLTLIFGPVAFKAVGSMFWFFTYRLTLTPFLIVAPVFALLGVLVPLAVYRSVSKATIVERLREVD